MKKFLVRIIVFFVAIALIDIIFGKCCDYMYEHSKSGDSRKINYAIRECNADILIMGSSRANHHYNPQILSDSLGLSCYNLGIDGSGVILMDGFYRLITQRYIPKYIIYELTPSFDLYEYAGDANNTRYLTQLKPYYREDCLKQLFDDVNGCERLKLYSGLYRYNTSCFNLFISFLKGKVLDGNGYEPLHGVMTVVKRNKRNNKDSILQIDTLKIKYLTEFIRDCKANGTMIFFVVSPSYRATSSIDYQPLFEICRKEGCEVIDCYCDPNITFITDYFKDSYHLNKNGADAFSTRVANNIKKQL